MFKGVKLTSISKVIGSGVTPLRSNALFWENGTIPWLKTEQLGERQIFEANEKITEYAVKETAIKIFPVNTLSIAMYGEGKTRGNVSILKSPMTTNQACCNIIVDDKKADFEYVYYFLKTQYNQLRALSSGIRKNLNSNDIKEYVIRLPEELLTQQKIAAVLSALDSKIELNNRINAELEAIAKTLYDYWFVQFDFPDQDGKPYKTSGGKMVFNDELKREIPIGWEVKRFGLLSNIARGVTYNRDQVLTPNDKKALPILRATNINDGEIDLDDLIYVPANLVSVGQRLQKFDVLITMSSGSKVHIGKNAFYYFDKEISFGAFCSKLSIHKDYNFYIFTHLQSKEFKKYIANVCLGTNINNLTNEHLTNYRLLIPSAEQLELFQKMTQGFYNRIANNLIENQQLAELRDWLLPMLMNGQIVVKAEA